MCQIEIYGEKSGLTAWHPLPRDMHQRILALAEIKQLSDPNFQIPSALATGNSCKKFTHRSMVQLSGNSEYTASLAFILDEQQNGSPDTYCNTALIIKQYPPCNETAFIQGTRWKNTVDSVEILAKHNGESRFKQQQLELVYTVILEMTPLNNFKPGDVLEITFRKNKKIFDRISVNFGLKQSA